MRSLDRCQPRCFLERVVVFWGLCFLSGTVWGSGLRCGTILMTTPPSTLLERRVPVWRVFWASFHENRLNLACWRFRDTDGSYRNVGQFQRGIREC